MNSKYIQKYQIYLYESYIFSTVLNPVTVVFSMGGGVGFLNIIAATAAAIKTATQAMTIPAIAPPERPLELFEYLGLVLVDSSYSPSLTVALSGFMVKITL